MATPRERFRSGGVFASVWQNEQTTNKGTFITESVTFGRRYKRSDGNWDTTTVFNKNDLPKLQIVCQKAYDFLNTKKSQQKSRKESPAENTTDNTILTND